MIAVVIATSRKGAPDQPRELWADVILAVNSVTLYAPRHELVLAWQGPVAPDELMPNPRVRVLRQPDDCRSYGAAYGWAVGQTDADELILMNDDAVLTPASIRDLLADVALIRREHPDVRIGMLAARTNFAPGPQNVRAPNGGTLAANSMGYDSEARILAAERVSPILAYLPREALERIGGFPPVNWFSDDLMCWDLVQNGYTNFVSRAYVHHVGMRSTLQGRNEDDLLREGQRWVREHRPDFWKKLGSPSGSSSG